MSSNVRQSEPELFDYGIHNESADLRAHVGVIAQCVFVFPVRPVLQVMSRFKKKPAFQRGIEGKTAEGYTVPLEAVPYLRTIRLSSKRLEGFTENLSTSEKGERAVRIIADMLKAGRFPLWVEGSLIDDVGMQIDGEDIHVKGKWRIQVKCDYRAGPQTVVGCTGNLYLQIAERNPLGRR